MNYSSTRTRFFSSILYLVCSNTLMLLSSASLSQNSSVEFANGFPVAPTGLQNLPLGDGPWDYRTGEDMNIHVELVARMEYAMAIAFMPDDSMLVATRQGLIYQISDGEKREVSGAPPSVFIGESGGIGSIHGYIDIKLHPDFSSNGFVYLMYTRTDAEQPAGILTIGRGHWNGRSLENFEMIYDTGTLNGAGRMVFGTDGKLFFTTPDREAQSLLSFGGKVMRINDDGSIPGDNPFVDTPNALPEIWSYGHRYSLGLTLHPETGALWQNENGPNGGDEVNIIEAGLDYGWPTVSFGRGYQGPWHAGKPGHEGYTLPVVYWMPSIAVAGMAFYTADALPKWKNNLFVGALREGEVNGTGHLERILFNDEMEELRRESLLVDLHKRIRDVVQGPDGFLYVALEDKDGGVLRIMPVR